MRRFLPILLLAGLVGYVIPIEIDNNLVGDPVVDCQDTMVSLTFKTEKPFTGRIYVKGLADDDRCSRSFSTNEDQRKFAMLVPTGDCQMGKQRVAGQLEGIMFSLVVVVSFHGTFVTKVDRAYRCMCFFRNIKRVTNILDLSPIPTTELLDTAKMPTCNYFLRFGTADGRPVRYAKVGDKIFHVWECDDPAHGFLVHSCWANDGRGSKFDFYDIDGCAVDPIIMPDVKYLAESPVAYVESHGFKFSDTSVLNFQCVIELCKKALGECDGLTPPNCGARGKRAVEGQSGTSLQTSVDRMILDVVSTVDILDSFEEENSIGSEELRAIVGDSPYTPQVDYGRLCVTPASFGMLLSIIVITFITTVVMSSMLCFRERKKLK